MILHEEVCFPKSFVDLLGDVSEEFFFSKLLG